MDIDNRVVIRGTPYEFHAFFLSLEAEFAEEIDGISFRAESTVPRREQSSFGSEHYFPDTTPREGDNPIVCYYYVGNLPSSSIKAYGLPDNKTRLIVNFASDNKEAAEVWAKLLVELEEYRMLSESEQQVSIRPQHSTDQDDCAKPSKTDGFNAWFDYYYCCKKIRRKYTLPDMAKDTGYSLSHLKAMHGLYKADKNL